jgi:hypothetical protein
VIAAMESGELGFIDTPAQGNKRPAGVTWCADNGAYSDKFDEAKWWKFLTDNAADAGTCLFAVAPDVVGNAAETLTRSMQWLPKIRALGYPAAFVAQDGLERRSVIDDPKWWDTFDVLFIGGTTEWKLGPAARELAAAAKHYGKRIHVGRVNSEKRFRYAAAPYPFGLGADTADGTFLTFGPLKNLPRLKTWLRSVDQGAFDLGVIA